MKNKEVLSGILGGSLFAATYLAIGIPILPSILFGVSAFVGSELLMSKSNVFTFSSVNEENAKKVLEDASKKNKYIFEMIFQLNHMKELKTEEQNYL